MHPLEVYYLNQTGRSLTHSGELGPVYAAPHSYSGGTASANFSAVSFGWSDTYCGVMSKLCVSRRCVPDAVIVTDIEEIKTPELSHKDIGSINVIESVQNGIGNLCGGERIGPKVSHL
jgi:hypothetical protein